jgi:hypothetical protein
MYYLVGGGVVYGPPACWKVHVLRLVLDWNWYEIPFDTIGSLQAIGVLPTSNRVGLVSENNFLQVDFSVVFIDTHLENIISVFVYGVAVKRSVQLMCNLIFLVRLRVRIPPGHRCLFLVSAVCGQVEVSASG